MFWSNNSGAKTLVTQKGTLQGMPQNTNYSYNIECSILTMSQELVQSRHPEPGELLVERLPAKEGVKLSSIANSWEDIRGLSWLFVEDWS